MEFDKPRYCTADIVCFQETKLTKLDVDNLHRFGSADGWYVLSSAYIACDLSLIWGKLTWEIAPEVG